MRSLVLSAALIFALASSARAQLTPPSVLEAPPPRYPESALHGDHHGHEETVIVHVTIGADGALQAAHVDHSISPEFDAAALEAVRTWRFAPARQGETPIASNVRVAVRFVLPEIEHAHPPVIAPPEPPVVRGAAQPGRTDTEAHAELSATATAHAVATHPAAHAASDFVIERAVLAAAPRKDAAALLSAAPGVYVARSEGEPIAPSIFLRGFDAEHGQDIAFSASGLPINSPSHVHGQGYADIGFVIPEAVRYMRVTEGVYDPRQGDFAVAGSIDFELGVEERGLHAKTSYGSFDAFRQLVLWAPEGQPVESFGGAFYARSDGFGPQRAGASAGALAQHVLGTGPFRLRLIGSLYGARAELPGMVHRDDYEAGELDFYGVEDDPIARSQAASASEARLGLFLEQVSARGGKSELGLWLAQQSFEAQEGLTGHAHDHGGGEEDGGALSEQLNDAQSIGISARHATERYRLARWLDARLDAGLAGRFDRIEQSQRLLHAPPESSVDPQLDASIAGTSIGGHVAVELRVQKRLSLHAGARADALHYAARDRLTTLDAGTTEDGRIAGLSRSAFGVAAGPRLRAELKLTPWLSALAAYGQGFRSPQASALADGDDVRYAKVHSSDAGVRAAFERASISASAFHTALSQDFAFDADAGRLSPLGATTRTGGVLHATVHPVSFLIASASITYAHAVLDDGGELPYVPPLVVRADVGYDHRIGRAFGIPVGLRAGLGVSQLGERPLPLDLHSEPVTLCDASLALRYSAIELGLEAFNLFDARYAASEHVSPPDEAGEPPARFFAAGPPRSLLFTLALTL